MKIEWAPKYNTGIQKIDYQHMKLIEIINRLIEVYQRNCDRNEVEPIFLGLINYCNYHFTSEEIAMQDSNYPEYADHKYGHDIFFKKIDDFKLEYIRGNSAALLLTIDYLKEWLLNHILVEDKKYVPLLLDKF